MELPESFEEMTLEERILYVQFLWDSIADEAAQAPIDLELAAELDRRLAAHEADPSATRPWSEVKDRLLARLKP